MKKILRNSIALFALILGSCSNPRPPADYLAHNLGERWGDFEYSVDLGSDPKDVYFLVTNPRPDYQVGTLTVDRLASMASPVEDGSLAPRLYAASSAANLNGKETVFKDAFGLPRPDLPLDRYKEAAAAVKEARIAGVEPKGGIRPPNTDVFGSTNLFYGDSDGAITYSYDMDATCRWTSGPTLVEFPDGRQRKLSIWVANDQLDEISTDMVNALAARFFGATPGSADSIYHWVTNFLGDEWGNVNYPDLTEFDSCITILLCDIADPRVIGYYAPKNNFTDEAAIRVDYYGQHSNERMMFFIDSVMYADSSNDGTDNDTTWEVTDYYPEEVFSTLAHEFLHMISFYKIWVVDGDRTGNWFDELCSQAVEDLVADKLGVIGPRGVDPADYTAGAPGNDEGRIPNFNSSTEEGLGLIDGWKYNYLNWDYYAYAQSYSFGAYLIRNYGGADFMRRLFQASGAAEERIAQASGRTFKDLLAYWSMAALLSDRTDTPNGLILNRGGSFDSVVGGLTYRLGSINHYNYVAGSLVGPGVISLSTLESIEWYHGYGTWFCLAGTNQSGERKYAITSDLPDGFCLSVVAK